MRIGTLVEPIQGWLHPQAGAALYRLARLHAPAATAPDVVALGSWKGRSTAWLAFALKDRAAGGRVWAVDTWAGSPGEPGHRDLLAAYGPAELYREFCDDMERLGLADYVSPVVSDTVAAARAWPADRPVGLLFVDASHDYAAVRRDFEHWAPHVADGGFVVFDDVPAWPGPHPPRQRAAPLVPPGRRRAERLGRPQNRRDVTPGGPPACFPPGRLLSSRDRSLVTCHWSPAGLSDLGTSRE